MKLGVITNNRHEVFQRTVIVGVEQVAVEKGYQVVVDSIAENPAQPQPISLHMDELAGLLVIADILPDEELRELYRSGKPLSLISHQIADVPIPAVIANNTQGMAILMRHLVVDCGCKRFVVIRGNMHQNDGFERDAAFWHEVMRYNLHILPEFILDGQFEAWTAGEKMSALLQNRRDFDAVIAADYLMALAAMQSLKAAGLSVPEEVQVAGFGDGVEADAAGLTTVAADVVQQGRRCTRQLIGQIEGLRIRGVTVLNTHLVPRSTTGAK
jgi:LacI family transcriptional regulator